MNETTTAGAGGAENDRFLVPGSVLVAGLLIAGALVWNNQNPLPSGTGPAAVGAQQLSSLEEMDPITSDDHIRGNPNAPIKIVEYSDTECPFCKRFHTTLQQVMEKYGDEGKVAWVYRHFPLDQLHSKARKEAEATECAAELGGNDVFWAYLDRLMEITPTNNGLDLAELPKIAAYVGLDVNKFNQCLDSGRHAEKIERHVKNAVATGGRGTPWSILVGADGKAEIPGALPFANTDAVIQAALN